ncbi:MAG: sigma-54 interaction domain-containing protein [Bacteriovoracia bacterium]
MNDLITADRKMSEMIQLAKTVAQSKATVLIQGESGTGKEVMANLIHQNSSRANRPFVAINCAAIPENLLESELFGHERGAFTGAVNAKAGKFEIANGGTLLLDEISEMDIRLQAKLLRVIQEGEVDRIGGRKPIAVDVRIIATTNKNLASCVTEGTFREDLYYRLNVVNLTLPPLRDRIGDVKNLAEYFVGQYSQKNGRPALPFSPEALAKLEAYAWPGNIRELANVIERSIITAKDASIGHGDIMIEYREDAAGLAAGEEGSESYSWNPGQTLNDIERSVILEALQYHNGNRTHTARALGISIRTLRNKLSDYRKIGIQV